MSAKHRSAQYQRNARLRREQVKAAHKHGEPVACWRGGGLIAPGEPFDIGHRHPHGGEGLDNLWPEHRHRRAGCCIGNRADGGAMGARLTNRPPTEQKAKTWKL